MSQPEWETLAHEVQELRARVARMEAAMGLPAEVEAAEFSAAAEAPAAALAQPELLPTAVLPIVGRALLGLAGAFLLRALTEGGTLSPRMGVAVGLLYAASWLVWAVRTPAVKRLETALHGLTAVLVLSPLVYEATARLHALSAWSAGGLLFAFTVFGFAVSWRKDLLIVATFATLAGLGTSAALLMATHDVLPFVFVFLAIAAAVEVSACLDHWLSERWLTAAMADLAVLLATWLVTNERGLPASYAPIPHAALLGAQVALLGIYLTSTIVRTLLRGFTFTGFETMQCAVAFAISVGGGLQLTSHDGRVAPALAVLMLGCAGACYVVAFVRLDAQERNFYTYSTFGLLLAIAGSRIVLSGAAASIAWSVLAFLLIWIGGVYLRLSLKVHGCVFLVLSLAGSSAIEQASGLLLGSRMWPGGAEWAIWSGAAAASLSYLIGTRRIASVTPSWRTRTWRVLVGGSAVLMIAGIAAGLLTAGYHLAFGAEATHAYCATLRTFVLAAGALVLAWASAHWSDRPEFGRLVYPVMALGGYRLIAVDLRQDRTAALFLSLMLYGAALMLLPRLHRTGTSRLAASGA